MDCLNVGISKAHKETVQILLKDERIEINQHDKYGDTALMWACSEGHKEIVEMLIQDKQIQINQQNKIGYTSLMLASERGHEDIVQMLEAKENESKDK
jgi:ankyrin repeat protein